MLLLNKPKKLQLGGSLNQARNENAKVDNAWNKLDASGFKHAPLEVPDVTRGVGSGGRGGEGLGGIPSDIAYANAKLTEARQKLTNNLSGPTSAEYQNSMQFKQDSEDVNTWAENLSMLKSMGENYKTTKTKLQKAGDDYAMFGGKALVKDASAGNAYTIVSTPEVLTERIADDKGKLRNRYTPATVGEALDVRFGDAKFSGFNTEGGTLDNILSNVIDSESVYKEMDNLFKEAGMINEDANTFVSSKNGSATTLSQLIADLESASAKASKNENVRSNAPTLGNAIDLFTQDLNPTQIQALRNKAMAQFVNTHGDKNVSEATATEWVNNQVDATIAKRASIYLNFAAKGKTKAATTPEGDLSKKKINTNKITLARMGVGGEKVKLEGDFEDAEDLHEKFSILATVNANSVPISRAYASSIGAKGAGKVLSQNQFIKDLTGDQIQSNFFLADNNSTPVNNVGQGLERAVINPSGGPMKILQAMPYTKDANGNYKIAWEKVKQVTNWGKKYRELYNAKAKETGGKRLSEEDKKEVILATEKLLGPLNDDPSIKVGDIAMVPILIDVPPRGYHDEMENVMSNKVSSAEKEELDKGSFTKNIHKTFAFTVLQNGPQANLSDNYGKEMAIDKEMSVEQILQDYATTARTEAEGFDVMPMLMSIASTSPEVTK